MMMGLFEYLNPKTVARGLAGVLHKGMDRYVPGFHEVVRTRRRRAAVAAVATAMVRRNRDEETHRHSSNPDAPTAWQAVMRSRQIKQRGR